MKLTTKFSVGIGLITMGIVFAAVLAVVINNKFNSHVEAIGGELLPSIATFDGLDIDAHKTRALVLEMLITDDNDSMVRLAAELDSVGASSEDFLRRFASDKVNDEVTKLQFREILSKRSKAQQQAQAVKSLALKHDLKNAKTEWRRMDLNLNELENALRDARESALTNADRQVAGAAQTMKHAQFIVAIGTVLIFGLNALILTWAYRNIASPIQSLALELDHFERSPNLKMRFADQSVSELSLISRSLNVLMDWVHFHAKQLQEQRDQIHQLANHDQLTGLPSWRLGKDRLELAIAWSKRTFDPVGVMFVDLDGFKAINDTYGHDAGDFLLCEIANRLKGQLRLEDTVARMGGDEFVVILARQASENEIQHIALRIIEAVSHEVTFGIHQLHVGASIGIAVYPTHGRDVDALLDAADKAMYSVKRTGKNNFASYSADT
jgi:diguanylate cyclase (GGDEF)-like protein